MATIQIFAPVNGSQFEKTNWSCNVSQFTEAGNDVEFIDEKGNPCNVPFVGLMSGTDGSVVSKTVTGNQISQNLAPSGYHQIWVSKIFSTSGTGLGITVKF